MALWAFSLINALLLAGTLRQLGLIQLRLGPDPGALITDAGLERGTPAPDFEATDASSGTRVRLHGLSKQARVLIFVSPDCVACQTLVEGVKEVAVTRRGEFDFVFVCRDQLESCLRFARRNGIGVRMLIDVSGEAEAAFEVSMTPFVYLLDSERRVLIRGIANDWRGLESILEQEGTQEGGRPWMDVPEPREVEVGVGSGK